MTKHRHIKAWRLGAAIIRKTLGICARAVKDVATQCGVMIKRGGGSTSSLKGPQRFQPSGYTQARPMPMSMLGLSGTATGRFTGSTPSIASPYGGSE